MEHDLRAAIQRDELAIHYQPIVDLRTGRIGKFEALVRWFHPLRGEISPVEFIPLAERSGLIITLGNWITRTAARAAATWPEDVALAVNLSPVQIQAPGAELGVLAALRVARLPAHRLELEVSESLLLAQCDAAARFMAVLAAEGVRFTLADVGTGDASLEYITRYPVSAIKVDRSLVSGLGIDRSNAAIIRAVADMGETLGIPTIAVGLETAEQVAAVRRAGCTLGQGWHFSRAVPEVDVLRLLQHQRTSKDGHRRVR